MFRGKRTLIFVLFIASISPFVFYSSPLKPWVSSGGGGTVLQEFLYPFEYAWHNMYKGVRTTWNRYFDLVDAAEEARFLREQLALIQTRIIDYDSQVQEVQRLRKLLEFKQASEIETLTAEVIGGKGVTHFHSLRISRGTMDEVKIGMPIVSPKGVVGKVIRTGLQYSDVLLLDDSNFNLDVIVERTRTRGILQGMSSNLSRLKVPKRTDVKIGDTLITSGIIGGFPKGLPVGTVVKISFKSDNVTQSISVEPWVDASALEEVVILKQIDKEVQEILDTAGSDWIEKSAIQSEG